MHRGWGLEFMVRASSRFSFLVGRRRFRVRGLGVALRVQGSRVSGTAEAFLGCAAGPVGGFRVQV